MIRIASAGLAVVVIGLAVGCNSGTGGPRNDAEVKGTVVDDKTGKKSKAVDASMEDPNAKKK